MPILELTKDNFEDVIVNNDTVIVDFWAPWCAPCRAFAPTFESTSEKYAEIVFAKINTEEENELSNYFQIRSIPTLMVFRQKVVLFSQAGALPASAFEELIQQVLAVDMAEVHREVAAQANPSGQASAPQ